VIVTPRLISTVVRVADGDTVTLGNGQRVRLVQIDTPEVYFGAECYGPTASPLSRHSLARGLVLGSTTHANHTNE
jgi:endonuclease YncB( thermonuclease family)